MQVVFHSLLMQWDQIFGRGGRQSAHSNVCFRLFYTVDGLDEYSGDSMDLVELFEDAAVSANPNIKVCLSSRPLLEFKHAFTACFYSMPIAETSRSDTSRHKDLHR